MHAQVARTFAPQATLKVHSRSILPSLLAASQLFCRRFHRILISPNNSLLCLNNRAFLLLLATGTEVFQNLYLLRE